MIITATLKRRFVCRCVFSCGVELGPQVTWCGTACAASLNGSCSQNSAQVTQGCKNNLLEFLKNKTGLTSADFKKRICMLFLGVCF